MTTALELVALTGFIDVILSDGPLPGVLETWANVETPVERILKATSVKKETTVFIFWLKYR
jgi:hypothetical protein